MTSVISRRKAAKRLLFAITGTSLLAYAQEHESEHEHEHEHDHGHTRDIVDRVQADLERAADFTRNNGKESERYHNVQHHLSEFDRELRRGRFDKDKLDTAIDDLKNVVKNNTLESKDRDTLAADLSDLRTLRDIR